MRNAVPKKSPWPTKEFPPKTGGDFLGAVTDAQRGIRFPVSEDG